MYLIYCDHDQLAGIETHYEVDKYVYEVAVSFVLNSYIYLYVTFGQPWKNIQIP